MSERYGRRPWENGRAEDNGYTGQESGAPRPDGFAAGNQAPGAQPVSQAETVSPNGPGSRTVETPGQQVQANGEPVRRRTWEERISEALEELNRYRAGKASLEQRIIEAERYYRQHNWAGKRGDRKKFGVRSNSGWLFNSCIVKHADAMDNYPEPNVLPREQSDDETAKVLTEVLPCVLELNDYEEIYDRGWWDKIIKGTAVTCVTWDSEKSNGLGDVSVSRVDILSVYWDPAVADIQQSRDFFCVALVDNRTLEEEYGDLVKDKLGSASFVPGQYAYETTHNTAGKSAVIDWYYKRNGVLHLCKFVENIVLYASEDDERYAERGYYDHGLYPFVFDPLYPVEGSPAGFGQVDLCRDAQDYIDRLDSAILDSALINARPKHFINNAGGVNEDEAMDPERPFVHVNGSGAIADSVQPYPKSELNGLYIGVLNNKISELREVSGSTAAAQGGASAGVTAYSAIAAMQEAAGKGSRDLIRAGYRKYKDICYMMIELFRQFYNVPRVIRITGQGGENAYMPFDNSMLGPQAQPGVLGVDFTERLPVFDIKIKAAKQTAYSRIAQNELAKELYGAGMFAPQNADSAMMVLDMMSFEGKDKIMEKIRQNGGMYQMLQQMAMQIQQLQAALGMRMQQEAGGQEDGGQRQPMGEMDRRQPDNDSLGAERQQGKRISAPRERAEAANSVG
jgi:hypothetical protein